MVVQLGFQRDNKWLFSGSDDMTVKVWDLRAPGVQREYGSRAPVCTVVLHPNSGELISGANTCWPPSQAAQGAVNVGC